MARSSFGMLFRLTFVIAILTLSACGLVNYITENNASINGSQPLLTTENAPPRDNPAFGLLFGNTNSFAKVDLVALLFDGSKPSKCLPSSSPGWCPGSWFSKEGPPQECLALALQNFYSTPTPTPSATPNTVSPTPTPIPTPTEAEQIKYWKKKRNRVQDILLAASESTCSQFTQHLNTYQAYSNFFFGALATSAGAAGAIVTNKAMARTLAGTAGALTGIRAEYNNDIFYQKAVPMITLAITQLRYNFCVQIRGHCPDATNSTTPGTIPISDEASEPPVPGSGALQALNIDQYPVEAAIQDALKYNDLCSLDKGFEKLHDTLSLSAHPGLDMLIDAQQKENELLSKQIDSDKLQKERDDLRVSPAAPISVFPNSLKFDTPAAGTSATKQVKVHNHTGAPVDLDITISESGLTKCFPLPGALADPVAAGSPPLCSSSSPLAADQSCTVTVKLTEPNPAPADGCQAHLVIADSVNSKPHRVPLGISKRNF